MSGKKSRNKGAGFERRVAALFSEAYGASFRRTPLSGGWAPGFEDVAGDIVCVEPNKFDDMYGMEFAYCVECKKSEGWRLESLFTSKHSWFDNWWAQLLDECPNNKDPILVFSHNRAPIWIAAKPDVLWGCPGPHLTFMADDGNVIVALFEQFLEWDVDTEATEWN